MRAFVVEMSTIPQFEATSLLTGVKLKNCESRAKMM
jgi:hypothetical protein